MAIYSCNLGIVSRGKGQSAVAAAAYRHRARMRSEFTGIAHDYSNNTDLVAEGLVLPRHAPPWALDLASLPPKMSSEKLWNSLEAHEKRRDASLAYSIMVALPRELGLPDLARAARDLARHFAARMQTIVDFVVHSDAQGHNPHAHFLAPQRPLVPSGFGPKRRPLLDMHGRPQLDRFGRTILIRHHGYGFKEFLLKIRRAVARILTWHLRRNGHAIELSSDSYRTRGLDVTPTAHVGPTRYAKKPEHVREQRNEEVQKGRAREILARPLLLAELLGFHKTTFTAEEVTQHLQQLPFSQAEASSVESALRSMTPRTSAGTFTAPSRELELRALAASLEIGPDSPGPSLVAAHQIPANVLETAVKYATPLAPHSKKPGQVVVLENIDYWSARELDEALRALPRKTRAYLTYSDSPGAQALRGQGASVVPAHVPELLGPAPEYVEPPEVSRDYEEPEFGY